MEKKSTEIFTEGAFGGGYTEVVNDKGLSIGTTLQAGKYTVEHVIGAGGFGITYYVRHNALGSHFAMKEFFINGYSTRQTEHTTIALQGLDKAVYDKYLQKFIEEAQTLARLNHPNIVKIVDVFQENNTAYIVMPFVEGQTLQQIVAGRGRLNYETALDYITQLSEAVDYIHQRDILHRDIKPENIIITPLNKAILIDFGSAREFIQDKTQSHTTILTHGYAPLEQYSPSSRKGSYTDIYSLGAVFYFALTGKKPMDATMRTMQAMPEPKTLVPNIPDAANYVIMKAMQLQPELRYQRIGEFVGELLNRRKTREKKKKKKSKFIWIFVIILLLIGGGLGYVKYQQERLVQERIEKEKANERVKEKIRQERLAQIERREEKRRKEKERAERDRQEELQRIEKIEKIKKFEEAKKNGKLYKHGTIIRKREIGPKGGFFVEAVGDDTGWTVPGYSYVTFLQSDDNWEQSSMVYTRDFRGEKTWTGYYYVQWYSPWGMLKKGFVRLNDYGLGIP
ncbi:hypothetical protein AGMMS49965_07190 [Bacteroidia bacterium]|nr:hypothetical protein AGMMS49965_07190 [Bacteroidia bacterium]